MNSERGGQIGERRGRHGRPQTVNKATAKEKKKATQRSDESTTEEVMISGPAPRGQIHTLWPEAGLREETTAHGSCCLH